MEPYGGLAFYFSEPGHRDEVWQRVISGRYFTENVSTRDINPDLAEICLLSFDGETISHICLAKTSRGSVTARIAMKFSRYLNLDGIKVATLAEDHGLRHLAGQLLAKPVRRIDAPNWSALLTAIKSMRPALANALDEFEKNRLLVGQAVEHLAIETIAQERDATRLALEFFGLDKEAIKSSLEFRPPLEPAPFLKGLKAAKLLEDTMIDHDAHGFPEFQEMIPFVQGSVEYTKGAERVTVLNVNRAGVEHAVGVDLVYYAHRFNSYIMVQYKRLKKASRDWVFDLNDPQFQDDLVRMDAFNQKKPAPAFTGVPGNYRLNDQHFYFKFCEDVTYEPLNSSMIDGMYLPLEYLECLRKSPLTEGPRGGRVLSYGNVLRRLSNSEFIYLVRHGWVGSRSNTTEIITKLVRDSIDADKSVIVGVSSENTELGTQYGLM